MQTQTRVNSVPVFSPPFPVQIKNNDFRGDSLRGKKEFPSPLLARGARQRQSDQIGANLTT